jgi:hypothetical protein
MITYTVSHYSKKSSFDVQTSDIKASSEQELKKILNERGRVLSSIKNKK